MNWKKVSLSLAALLVAVPVLAQPVLRRGDDGLSTPGGGQTTLDLKSVPVEQVFGAPVVGSTVVSLRGRPFSSQLPAVDTLVRRPQDIALTNGVGGGPLLVVGLSLESEGRVQIGDQFYRLALHLSDFGQQTGQATFKLANGDGGTFSASLPVVPKLTFTNTGDGSVVIIDCGVVNCEQFLLSISNVGWVRTGGPGGFDPAARGETLLPPGIWIDTDGDGQPDLQLLGSSNFFPGITASAGFPESPFGIATGPIIIIIHWTRPPIPGPGPVVAASTK